MTSPHTLLSDKIIRTSEILQIEDRDYRVVVGEINLMLVLMDAYSLKQIKAILAFSTKRRNKFLLEYKCCDDFEYIEEDWHYPVFAIPLDGKLDAIVTLLSFCTIIQTLITASKE